MRQDPYWAWRGGNLTGWAGPAPGKDRFSLGLMEGESEQGVNIRVSLNSLSNPLPGMRFAKT